MKDVLIYVHYDGEEDAAQFVRDLLTADPSGLVVRSVTVAECWHEGKDWVICGVCRGRSSDYRGGACWKCGGIGLIPKVDQALSRGASMGGTSVMGGSQRGTAIGELTQQP